MSLPKLMAIIILGSGIHVGTTPPNSSMPESERKVEEGRMDVHISTFVLKAAFWTHAFIETIIIVGVNWSPQSDPYKGLVRYLLPYGGANSLFLSSWAVVATIFGAIGGFGRYQCYRALGRHFTFHVTVVKDHKLITTGPYGLVRHPAYTSGLVMVVSMLGYYMAPGSWMRESLGHADVRGWIVLLPVLIASASLLVNNTFFRLNAEDEMLRKEFGKIWETWAKRVPCKLIPGVY